MIFRVSDNSYFPSKRSYHIAFLDSFLGVVGALRMNVRLEREQHLRHGRLFEDGDQADGLKRRDYLGAFALRQNRPAFAFQSRDLRVGVDSNHQYVAQLPCALKLTDVSGGKNVKASACQTYRRAVCP